MPTSLIYIVPSTRGCSPWRPDAVMSTTGRGEYSLLRIFRGRRERTGRRKTCDALPTAGPYLRVMRFQGGRVVKKKRKLFPGLPPASPDSVASPPTPASRFGNIDPIPFRCTARIAHLTQDFPISQDRLTRVQLLFTRNLSPLQSSKFSFEYLLLPPRSAPEAVSPGLAPKASPRPPRPPTHRGLTTSPAMAGYRSRASAPSIFGANRFGR